MSETCKRGTRRKEKEESKKPSRHQPVPEYKSTETGAVHDGSRQLLVDLLLYEY